MQPVEYDERQSKIKVAFLFELHVLSISFLSNLLYYVKENNFFKY
jgi:hypothetical protein